MLPFPLREQVNMDFDKHAAYMKKLHEDTRATLEKHNEDHATKMNKNKRPMIFEEGDLVWLHLRKDRFPDERKSKLAPREDGPPSHLGVSVALLGHPKARATILAIRTPVDPS